MCLCLYFPKDTAYQKMRELFNISTTPDECRLWVYECVKSEVSTVFVLITGDLDDELKDDDNVSIRYIHSIVYFLFVLAVPYTNVRNKKS